MAALGPIQFLELKEDGCHVALISKVKSVIRKMDPQYTEKYIEKNFKNHPTLLFLFLEYQVHLLPWRISSLHSAEFQK